MARAAERVDYPPFREIRFDLTWTRIERASGQYDFSGLDPVVADLLSNGFRVLGILDYDNPLHEGPAGGALDGGSGTLGIQDPGPYSAFAAAVAVHFGSSIDYELWNEPNNAFAFWQSPDTTDPPDPAAYAALVLAAASALRAACPTCRILGGSLLYHGQESAPAYLAGLLAVAPDLWRVIDGLSYHAYPDYVPVAAPDFAGLSPSASADRPEVPLVEMAAELRSLLAKAGAPTDYPLAMTELGWPTGVDWNTSAEQARFLVRAALLSFSTGATPTCFYTLHDGPDAEDPEANFGLYAYDGTPKLAVAALATLAQSLGGAAFEADRASELGLSSQEHALSFLSHARRTTALWSDAPPRAVQVPVHPAVSATQLVSIDGTAAAIAPAQGAVAVTLGPDPEFLVERR